ncbi:MAG: S8 family serine peptidase, partial [Anaerolineae bacterium]|nr:S8 family serine peptidase [Anaerolineae bacterium]
MKRNYFIIGLATLLLGLMLSGCEITRSDSEGQIAPVEPIDRGQPTADTSGAPAPDTTTDPLADISAEIFPAPIAPEPVPIEGKVLLKLESQAAIQARSAELGPGGVVETEVQSLDQVLEQIGASELVPVVEDVPEATGDTLDTFAAQSEDAVQLYSVTFDEAADEQEVANLLAQDPTVEYAEPDYLAGITADPVAVPVILTPNDTHYRFQWNMPLIQAPDAWDRATGEGVIVAVIDTGIDFRTPDLGNTRRQQGYDFINDDPDPTDDQGHGTHVAGTIAQSTNNNLGVAGVAFNATLLPVKVLAADGQGSYEAIIQGIYFAVDQGANVINMSLAGRAGSQALREAVAFAHSRGVVVVAAAGNSNGPVEFPAAYDESVIAVGATGFDNARAPYSNFG